MSVAAIAEARWDYCGAGTASVEPPEYQDAVENAQAADDRGLGLGPPSLTPATVRLTLTLSCSPSQLVCMLPLRAASCRCHVATACCMLPCCHCVPHLATASCHCILPLPLQLDQPLAPPRLVRAACIQLHLARAMLPLHAACCHVATACCILPLYLATACCHCHCNLIRHWPPAL